MYLSVVPPPLVSTLWPQVAPYIAATLREGGEFTLGDMRKGVDDGVFVLWALINGARADEWPVHGAGLVEILEFPLKRIAHVFAWSADPQLRDAWLPTLGAVEEWAKEKGCDAVRISGRMGWKALLRDYRTARVVLEKDLRDDPVFVAARRSA